jgi:hypothetical protein
MKKAALLKVVNPVLALLFLAQAVTGIAHDPLQEMSYEVWKAIHSGGGLLLVLVAFSHVVLNWSWVRATFLKKRPG